MQQELVFTPTDFVALLNQTLEYAFPLVAIEGELANFRIAKNRWVYFDLKDEHSSVKFFGSVYQLPGPLEDGLIVRVVGVPRLHQRFGFSVNFSSILPVGEGDLKKAADLLFAKLQAEGLFSPERKRVLPPIPQIIGLITADKSAAQADFIKILDERWGGVDILLVDSLVQGDQAPPQLVASIKLLNGLRQAPEVIVITRGGGSAEDLAAFNDERVVRAIADSRVPTLIAIGHENDESLAELAADKRASTPSNAATILTPDKHAEHARLQQMDDSLSRLLGDIYKSTLSQLLHYQDRLTNAINNLFNIEEGKLSSTLRIIELYDPQAALRRGYGIVSKQNRSLRNIKDVNIGDKLAVKIYGGTIKTEVQEVIQDDQAKS